MSVRNFAVDSNSPNSTLCERIKGLKTVAGGWYGPCPAHDDEKNSLSIVFDRRGFISLHCLSGCSPEDVLRAANLQPFPFEYWDETTSDSPFGLRGPHPFLFAFDKDKSLVTWTKGETYPLHYRVNPESYASYYIKYKARKLAFGNETDIPDIEEQLWEEVFRKFHYYDPSRGAISTFIAAVVSRKAQSLCRARKAQKRGGGLRTHPLSEVDDVRYQRETAGLDDAKLRKLHEVLESQPDEVRQVADLNLEGKTEHAISKELGISRRQVRKLLRGLLEPFRDAGLEDCL